MKDQLGPFKPLEDIDYEELKNAISITLKNRLIKLEVKEWEMTIETLLIELNKYQSILTMSKV